MHILKIIDFKREKKSPEQLFELGVCYMFLKSYLIVNSKT